MSADPKPIPAVLPDRAKPARATLSADRGAAETPDYLPARMVNEFVYCPRLFYYEWVEGVFVHNADTTAGAVAHARVRAPVRMFPRLIERCPTEAVRDPSRIIDGRVRPGPAA